MAQEEIEKLIEKYEFEYNRLHKIDDNLSPYEQGELFEIRRFIKDLKNLDTQLAASSVDNKAIGFTDWVEENYTMAHCKSTNEKAWIDNEIGVLINGSDSYFSRIISIHGKTTQELYDLYLKET